LFHVWISIPKILKTTEIEFNQKTAQKRIQSKSVQTKEVIGSNNMYMIELIAYLIFT